MNEYHRVHHLDHYDYCREDHSDGRPHIVNCRRFHHYVELQLTEKEIKILSEQK